MQLPYVIDNRAHRLADVLNDLLHSDAVRALDVATACVNAGTFDLVSEGLEKLASFRPSWDQRLDRNEGSDKIFVTCE
jgi:hypothetical protein